MSDVPRTTICLTCRGRGFHASNCPEAYPRRKKRLGEKVGDFIEEMIDTLVDFASDILEGFDVRNR